MNYTKKFDIFDIKSPYGFVENIFDKLKFPEPRKYAFAVVHESYSTFDDYYHLRDKGKNFNGGGTCKYESIKVKYGKSVFVFDCVSDYNMISYILRTPDNYNCVVILISDNPKIAYIDNLNNYDGCVEKGLYYPHGGSLLLKVALTLLIQNQHKLGISRVQLRDVSFKKCYDRTNKRKPNIRLGDMLFLIQNDTWYGRYGFKPYDSDKDVLDKNAYKSYLNNQKIISQTKIKDIKLYEYIHDAVKQLKLDFNLKDMKEYIERNKEMYITEFFKKFMSAYDKLCVVFEQIYSKIFDDLDLRSFHGMSFYLDLPKL